MIEKSLFIVTYRSDLRTSNISWQISLKACSNDLFGGSQAPPYGFDQPYGETHRFTG